ncbi:MAG TPA: glycosyltransferase family 2 protein [Gammaproteobacteria bacterium]|nr:glycosyltransferase family 2 protein [Gammaproteobacteria bacterium]
MSAAGGGFEARHRIGILVLNFNGAELTRACVASILAHTSPSLDFAILVVDNGSDAGELERLASLPQSERLRLVASRINLGFGGGHAFGLQFLWADHYLFLNSDCVFRNDVVAALAEFFDRNPRAGLASGLSFDSDGNFRANYHPAPNLGELLVGRALARRFAPARFPDRRQEPREPLAVEVAGGAALYVRAEAFFAVGGFDPFFFLYCEEEDLALRLRRAGWGVWIVPGGRFFHAGGGSTPKDPAYRREFFISFLHYLRKHRSAAAVLAFRVIYALKLLRRAGRDAACARLAWFVLCGANPAASLRFRQRPREL